MTRPRNLATNDALTGVATIRERVFDCLWFSDGLTPDEVAMRLGLSVLTVRPRCSELMRQGRIVDSGQRRANASGRQAKVLTVPRSRADRRRAAQGHTAQGHIARGRNANRHDHTGQPSPTAQRPKAGHDAPA